MEKCYWRSVAVSPSKEGLNVRTNHAYIPFGYCRRICDGFKSNCEFYEIRNFEEDNKLSRLESLEPVNYSIPKVVNKSIFENGRTMLL